jgi:hypothetical protein
MTMLRDWASRKVEAGSEPPWAWYQYMKLIETLAFRASPPWRSPP